MRSGCTWSRITDSASVVGVVDPGPVRGEMPFPVATMMRPGPSETSPPPDCQMPAPALAFPVSVAHIEARLPVAASMPTT